jgi:tetratricopeptide (TPR) repeat protein
MKSDHRHELKTNELADWLMHFPEWAEQNRTTLIAAGAIIVVVIGVYFVRLYRGDSAAVRNQVRLTTLVSQLTADKSKAAQAPDAFIGFGTTATELKDFADHVGSSQMAAFALIKRGEALRSELHFGAAQITPDEVAKQVDLARESYTQALQLASSSPSLAATAKFGLGLCEEELGNFDKAKDVYREIAKDPNYEGTSARSAAANRVKAVDEYKTAVVFQPAPLPKPPTATAPGVEIRPRDANAPAAIPSPNNVTVKPVAPKTTPESNSVPPSSAATPAPKPAQPAEANRPAGAQ